MGKIKTSGIVMVRDMTKNWGFIQWLYYFIFSRSTWKDAKPSDWYVQESLKKRDKKGE